MRDRIELLVKLGMSREHALDFVKNITEEAYNAGGNNTSMDCDKENWRDDYTTKPFQDWFNVQLRPLKLKKN